MLYPFFFLIVTREARWQKEWKKKSSSLQCLSCTCNRSELCKRFEDFVECHSSLTDRAANLCGSFSCICCPFVSHMRSLLHLNLWRLWTAGELLESLDIFSELPRRTSFAQRLLTQFFFSSHMQCPVKWKSAALKQILEACVVIF